MSGPPPHPSAIKHGLRGNPGKQALNRREPRPGPSKGLAPLWLDSIALEVWQEYAPRLQRLGLLDELSELPFAICCERISLYRRALLALGGGIAGPEVSTAKAALEGARVLLAEVGVSPGSRSRIVTPPTATPTSPWVGLVKP